MSNLYSSFPSRSFNVDRCSRPRHAIGVWLGFLLILGACTSQEAGVEPVDHSALRVVSEQLIASRDSLFRSDASPLVEADRESFQGLSYFPYDSTLAFRINLQPILARDTIRMVTSTGEARPYIPYGTFRFDASGRGLTLTVFKPVGEDATPGHLFLPFRDQTSGSTTYGGGRYLDLTEDETGIFTLDFNQAYHPYCVYNPLYSCPVPPPENRLSVAIEAGERLSDAL